MASFAFSARLALQALFLAVVLAVVASAAESDDSKKGAGEKVLEYFIPKSKLAEVSAPAAAGGKADEPYHFLIASSMDREGAHFVVREPTTAAPPESADSSGVNTTIVIAGAVAGAVALLGAGGAIYGLRRRSKRQQSRTESDATTESSAASLECSSSSGGGRSGVVTPNERTPITPRDDGGDCAVDVSLE